MLQSLASTNRLPVGVTVAQLEGCCTLPANAAMTSLHYHHCPSTDPVCTLGQPSVALPVRTTLSFLSFHFSCLFTSASLPQKRTKASGTQHYCQRRTSPITHAAANASKATKPTAATTTTPRHYQSHSHYQFQHTTSAAFIDDANLRPKCL